MSPGIAQKNLPKSDSQNVSNRATPNQLTVPEVANLTEHPIEWRNDVQYEKRQTKKKMDDSDKDVLSSKEIKSESSTGSKNSVESDFSQNNSNFGQTSSQSVKKGPVGKTKYRKQLQRNPEENQLKTKETLLSKGNLLSFPSISIISPQGVERAASLDDKDEEENIENEDAGGKKKEKKEKEEMNEVNEEEPVDLTKEPKDSSNVRYIEGGQLASLPDKDPDEGLVTSDQRRALLELERQQNEVATVLTPFENNVKNRLYHLNQELSNEKPQKNERTARVGFREDLVQVISPTEDTQHPTETKISSDKAIEEGKKMEKRPDSNEAPPSQKESNDTSLEVFDMVVERDGHFDLVTPEDVTALSSKYAKFKQQQQKQQKQQQPQQQYACKEEKSPFVEGRTRPSSAITNRNPTPALIIPKDRPISSPNYHSPYGLTPKQKELARKKMALQEQIKQEEEERRRMREKEKQILNEQAFQCWLRRIQENEFLLKKKDEIRKEIIKKEKEEKEILHKKLNNEVFRRWIQNKYEQQKQEEQLKCHEDKEYRKYLQPRTQEEVDRAYKKWLKKKSQENKRQKFLAKQRYRLQQRLLRRSRLIRNMTWDVCLNNSFRFNGLA